MEPSDRRMNEGIPDAAAWERAGVGDRGNLSDDEFFERHQVRTDLAFEAQQVVTRASKFKEIPGVTVEHEELDFATWTRVTVETDQGAQVIGKAKGRYLTLQVPKMQSRNRELEHDVSQALADEIEKLLAALGVGQGEPVLVVGLGNWHATPDNVGPLTTSKLLVTRHLHEYQALSEELLGRMRPVAALSPGVLGLTGVETAEIVHGVVQRVRPAAVICVDALASMSIDRIGTTVQLSDVGINPGSGVGNKRVGLTRETLGVPVLVVGVPTVIYATTIVSEAVDRLVASSGGIANQGDAVPGGNATGAGAPQQSPAGVLDPQRIVVTTQDQPAPGGAPAGPAGNGNSPAGPTARGGWESAVAGLDEAGRKAFIREVLGDSMKSLVVTPKEVDVLVETLSDILADGLNEALHPGISAEEAAQIR